jgi:hypothetical protein
MMQQMFTEAVNPLFIIQRLTYNNRHCSPLGFNMKTYKLLPLSLTILLFSACSLIPTTDVTHAISHPAPVLPQPPVPPAVEPEPSAPYYQVNPKKFGESLNQSFDTQYSEYKAAVKSLKQQHYQAQLDAYNAAIQSAIQFKRDAKDPTGKTIHVAEVPPLQLPEAPQILIERYQAKAANPEKINIAALDLDLTYLETKARHYAPVFTSKAERKQAEVQAKKLTKALNEYASSPEASYDVLIRAMKANVISRNMDVGNNATEKSIEYFERIFKLKPKDPEASYWYGFSLAEGGGFAESISHLNVAIKANYQEAYLALANTYLLQGKKKNATDTLNTYKSKFPSEAKYVNELIAQIKTGERYSIWQYIPDPNMTASVAQ